MPGKNKYILLLFLIFGLSGTVASGCECMISKGPCAEFKETPVVFVGVVNDISSTPIDAQERKHQFGDLTAHVTIKESLKGVNASEIDIHTSSQGTACGFPFNVGTTYLIYAYRNDDDTSFLSTSICTRTRPVESVEEEVKVLRELAAGNLRPTVYGVVNQLLGGISPLPLREKKPMARIQVILRGNGMVRKTKADDNGRFVFNDLLPGRYKLSLDLPPGFKMGGDYWEDEIRSRKSDDIEVSVEENDCSGETEIIARVDGRISGRVYDSSGKPAGKNVRISLVSFDKSVEGTNDREWISAYTDHNGYYEYKGIPPGKYLLGINLDVSPYKDSPYPVTYYPGSGDVSKATIIELGFGQRLTDYNISLPPPIKEITIKGRVLDTSGNPVPNAYVYVSNRARDDFDDFKRVRTNSKGEFRVKCLEGVTYSFEFDRLDGNPNFKEKSETIRLKISETAGDVVLRLY